MKTILVVIILAAATLVGTKDAHAQDVKADAADRHQVTTCELAGGGPRGDTRTPIDLAASCEQRDTARMFIIAGRPDAALRILCATKEARTAFGETTPESLKCLKSVGLESMKLIDLKVEPLRK